MDNIKQLIVRIISYLIPIQLGTHSTCDTATSTNEITHEELLRIVEEEIQKARAVTANKVSAEIKLERPTTAVIRRGIGVDILSITIPRKGSSSIIKMRLHGSKEVLKMSTYTFKKLFELKG